MHESDAMILSAYEAIGTIEECAAAMNKSKSMEVDHQDHSYGRCPVCHQDISNYEGDDKVNYCPWCGQSVLWTLDED